MEENQQKICSNCGATFTGNFCNECGTRWSTEKVCPTCGAKLSPNSKFCNECGYSFVSATQPANETVATTTATATAETTAMVNTAMLELLKKKKEETSKKIYSLLKYIPSIAFVLFSALVFIFYATPVAEMVIGGGIPNQNLGNVYSMYEGILGTVPEIKSAIITLIIIATINGATSIIVAVISFLPKMRYKTINIKDRNVSVVFVLSFIPYLFYAIIFALGIAVMAKIAQLDDGMGLLRAGSSAPLLISFSIIFTAFSATAIILRSVMKKRNPICAQDEITAQEAYLIAELERREQYYATHTEPQKPQENKTFETKKQKKEYKRNVVVYRHEKRRYDKAKEGSAPSSVIWLDLHKSKLITLTVILCVVIIALCILIPILTSIFRISVVEKIHLGDTQGKVKDVLGSPYSATSTETLYTYYDEDYTEILDKLQKVTKDQTTAFEKGDMQKVDTLSAQAQKLNEQLKTTAHKYVEVTFEKNTEDKYVVTSIFFDPERNLNNQDKKYATKKVSLSGTSKNLCYKDESSGKAEYKKIEADIALDKKQTYSAYFTNGAFYRAYINESDVQETEQNDGINEKVTFSDKFATYTVTRKNPILFTIDKNGLLKSKDTEELIKIKKVLTNLTIPDNVTSIESGAFSSCTSLTNVTMPAFAISDIPTTNFTTVVITSGSVIPYDAFSNCANLTSITIPNSVTSIGSGAFFGCTSLTSITIPDSVTSIGEDAFSSCASLTNATMPAFAISDIPKTNLTTVVITSGRTISSSAFRDCNNLTSVTIPDSVTSIGSYVFSGCGSLTSITIPDSVTSIESYAFEDCTSLTSITIPDSVTSIGYDAFNGCTSLTNVTIPDNVTSIKSGAFSSCTSLTNVTMPAFAISYIPKTSLTTVVITSGSAIPGSAFRDCTSLTSITIGNSVTSIDEYAFYNCDNLTSITIPDSVTSIGYRAFEDCTNLTSITIPDSVTSIGSGAFGSCGNLQYNEYDNAYYLGNSSNKYLVLVKEKSSYITSCTINSNTKFIHSGAFSYCDSLTSVTIGNSVTSIGSSAFAGCASLTNITIPDSVTSIGNEAFYDCDNLTNITIPNSVTYIGLYAFGSCGNLQYNEYDNAYYLGNSSNKYVVLVKAKNINITSCMINSNTKVIYVSAFYNCDGLTSVTIPDSVTIIDNDAFYGCDGLTSVIIGNSVTSIENYAFYSCDRLTSVTIPDSVTSIGDDAFYDCYRLTDVYYKVTQSQWQAIDIGRFNSYLTRATIHYNS